MFLLGELLSVFSSFLGTTSLLKTSDNFPEPRARFAEVQIFVISPLSRVFWIFWQLTVQLGPLKVLPSKIMLKLKFRNFLPAALTICSWRHGVNWWFFNQKLASRFFFGFNTKVSSISIHLGKNCSDLSSRDIEKRNTHKSVGDNTRFSWKQI